MSRDDANPTREQFASYEKMFAFFNGRLFGRELPDVLLNFSRHARTYGFFAAKRWERPSGEGPIIRHEISLNPSTLKQREPEEVASTLVHEMVHLWQFERGTPGRAGYHNIEWANKMKALGLVPTDTGLPGGKETGQHMTHLIDRQGAFLRAFKAIPSDCLLPWTCEEREPLGGKKKKAKTDAKNKVKYTCPECQANVWGKAGLQISCDLCGEAFEVLEPAPSRG